MSIRYCIGTKSVGDFIRTKSVGDFIVALLIGGFVVLCNTPMTLSFPTQLPSSLTVVVGGNIQETAYAVGGNTINYAWYKGLNPTTNPTTPIITTRPTLRISNVTTSDAGGYYVVASNNYGDVVASTLMMVIVTAIEFSKQPPSTLTVVIGGNIQETVVAIGVGTITYAWYIGVPTTNPSTTPIAKTATLTINNVTTSDAVEYYAVATNEYNNIVASTAMTVTVTAIEFSTQPPTTLAVVIGKTINETVLAIGPGTITYAWYMGVPTTTPSTPKISSSATLTITDVTNSNAGEYYAVASNNNGIVASTSMMVTIIPVFSTQPPTTLAVVIGGNIQETVVAIGGNTITYAWYMGAVPTTTPTTTPIAKTPTLTINNMTVSDIGGYYAVATNEYNNIVVSTLMTVTIMPVFSTQPPTTLAVVTGSTIQETVQATGGNMITYAWYKGLVPTTNPTTTPIAKSSTLTITGVTASNTGGYYVVATNNYNNIVVSTLMTVTIMPVFSIQPPTTLAVVTGGTIQETVIATGGNTITYAWYKGLVPTTNPTTPKISTTATLTITGVTASNAGNYYAVATNEYNNAVASTSIIVAVETVLAITTQPVSVSVKTGKVATFTVAISGGLAPYTYTWYQNGKVVSGATTATYTITLPTKAMNAAQIYVKISDSCTTPQIITSNTATLTIKPLIAWWLWVLIAAVIVVVVIIIIVVVIIVIHHKKSTKTINTPTQQPVPPPITSVGQPNYGFVSTGFNPTTSTGFNPTIY